MCQLVTVLQVVMVQRFTGAIRHTSLELGVGGAAGVRLGERKGSGATRGWRSWPAWVHPVKAADRRASAQRIRGAWGATPPFRMVLVGARDSKQD